MALYERLRPLARFTIKPQPFGFALIRGNRVVPVTPLAKSVLDALDGTLTLREVRQQFGEAALSLVGSLYRKGLVELEDSEQVMAGDRLEVRVSDGQFESTVEAAQQPPQT